MKKLTAGVLFALFILAAACAPAINRSGAVIGVELPESIPYDASGARAQIKENNPVAEEVYVGMKAFSYKLSAELFKELDTEENANFSPASLYFALSLAANGAGGATAEELYDTLGIVNPQKHPAEMGNLFRRLYFENEIGRLHIANSLWVKKEIKPKTAFAETAANAYYASVHAVDFADPAAGEAMSAWIKDNTGGRLAPEIKADKTWLMALINTVLFQDEWVKRFDEKNTAKAMFYPQNGDEVECDFMNAEFSGQTFFRGENFARAALSLKNGGKMVFVLPDEGTNLSTLLQNAETLRTALEGGTESRGTVIFKLPKFNFAYEADNLIDALKALGVSSAFGSGADFSNMLAEPARIDRVRQGTHIGVNEDGVEAAAYTMITMVAGRAPSDSQPTCEMILERPFLFAIVSENDIPLFIGVCMNPA